MKMFTLYLQNCNKDMQVESAIVKSVEFGKLFLGKFGNLEENVTLNNKAYNKMVGNLVFLSALKYTFFRDYYTVQVQLKGCSVYQNVSAAPFCLLCQGHTFCYTNLTLYTFSNQIKLPQSSTYQYEYL